MDFNRYIPTRERTCAFYAFRNYHTEINQIYWAYLPCSNFSKYHARKAMPTDAPATVFHASGREVQHFTDCISKWMDHYNEFETWVRLNCITSMVSYFEMYLTRIVTLSLRSSPGCRYGNPRILDGARWLKLGFQEDIDDLVINCVKGTWDSRVSGIKKALGGIPQKILDSRGELERIRNLRNKVGHTFGRDLITPSISEIEISRMTRLSHERLIRWLGMIYDIAICIDDFASPLIGSYESILLYNEWQADNLFKKSRVPFHKHLVRELQFTIGKQYTRELRDYYTRL